MKLVKGMLLALMLAGAAGAGAVEKAADAAGADGGATGGVQLPATGSGMSGDDEWACKVAMCMSNPGGPTEFAECGEPIKRLHRHLAKGRAFPVCPFTGGGANQQESTGSRSGGGRIDRDERDPCRCCDREDGKGPTGPLLFDWHESARTAGGIAHPGIPV